MDRWVGTLTYSREADFKELVEDRFRPAYNVSAELLFKYRARFKKIFMNTGLLLVGFYNTVIDRVKFHEWKVFL